MIAETLAGIALFNSAVAGIKEACNHAKSVGELGGLLDQLWTAEKQINQQSSKQSAYNDFSSIANTAIDRRLIQEQMNEIRSLITLRFGSDCWNEIIQEKAKREREMREAEARAALEQQHKQEELIEIVQMSLVVVFLVVLAIAMVSFAMG
jgi:hypothetical protein